jgi:hypothetical protein
MPSYLDQCIRNIDFIKKRMSLKFNNGLNFLVGCIISPVNTSPLGMWENSRPSINNGTTDHSNATYQEVQLYLTASIGNLLPFLDVFSERCFFYSQVIEQGKDILP